jgi:DNA-binding MarR family transcriptional regulator
LLEAFAARLEGRLVALTSLGGSEGIPRSTAHRWTRWLLDRGLLSSQPDPGDERITLVGLSDDAAERVRTYLANALSLSRWAA